MLLDVKNIDVLYDDFQVIWDVSINVNKAEMVALLGPNGSGKSTVLNTISNLVEHKKGSITFDNTLISNIPTYKRTELGISHVLERRRVFPHLTVKQNLLLGAWHPKAKEELTNSLNKVYKIFPKLETRSDQLAKTMSGGEQQMCAIGRAIMSGPKLLLMDEPSAGLAPVVVQQVFGLVKRIREEGYTVLIVEQNVQQVLKVADRAYLLEAGQLIESGNSADLLASETVRKAYMGL